MSHFDDIWPAIKDGLAIIGFSTLCMLFVFFFLMAKDALHDRRAQAKAEKIQQTSLEALRERWQGVGIEQH